MKVRIFDVAVLGRGIGGLVASLLLQRKGAKVVVLSQRRSNADDFSAWEFLNGFTLKPILKRVGFHPTEVNLIPPLEAPVQLVFPSSRLDFYGDERRFQSELEREFPGKVERILQLFREGYGHLEVYQHLFTSRTPYPPEGFLARRQFSKLLEQVCDVALLRDRKLAEELKSFELQESFQPVVDALQLALTDLISPWITGAHLAHLLTLVRWEGYSSPMGPADLQRMLLAKIEEHGGFVAEYDKISEIDVQGKEIQGAKIEGGDWDEVRWGSALVAGDPRGLILLGPKSSRFRDWLKSLDRLQIVRRKTHQLYRLAPEGIPVGMRSQGLIIPQDSAPSPERRACVRAIRYAVRWKPGSDGRVVVHLLATGFTPPDGDAQDMKRIGQEIRLGLETIIPSLSRHLIEPPTTPDSIPMAGAPGDFRQMSVYGSDDPLPLGVFGTTYRTPFRNVYQAGNMVFPGLGLDGEVMAGLQIVQSMGPALDQRKTL